MEDLGALVARGCATEARLVAHLAELDARKIHLRRSMSLFEYCQKLLGLSDKLHHEQAWCLGGSDTADNLRVMCSAHNQLLAEDALGALRRVTPRRAG